MKFEVTENFGDFWVSFFHVRNLLRCLVRVFLCDGCREIYDGDARRHLVRDAETLDRVPQHSSKLRRDVHPPTLNGCEGVDVLRVITLF